MPEPFDIADTIIVPADINGPHLAWGLKPRRRDRSPLGVEVNCSSFYDASAIEASIELDFRPNEYFEIAPGYEATFIDLPAGSFDIHVVEVDSVINFTPDMQLALQAQYDNISQASAFSRAIAGNICREAICLSHSDKAR